MREAHGQADASLTAGWPRIPVWPNCPTRVSASCMSVVVTRRSLLFAFRSRDSQPIRYPGKPPPAESAVRWPACSCTHVQLPWHWIINGPASAHGIWWAATGNPAADTKRSGMGSPAGIPRLTYTQVVLSCPSVERTHLRFESEPAMTHRASQFLRTASRDDWLFMHQRLWGQVPGS